ncbi:MAG: hypothetical protein AB9921_06240 [Erysipelotrichaceae bacterium]
MSFQKITIIITILLCLFISPYELSAKKNLEDSVFMTTDFLDITSLEIGKEVITHTDQSGYISITLIDYQPQPELDASTTMTPLSAGQTPWSGGSIPDGNSTLRIRRDAAFGGYFEYYATVNGSQSRIVELSRDTYSFLAIYWVTNYSIKIDRAYATDSLPAFSTQQFDHNTPLLLTHCYLILELNTSGQIRTKWNY